MCNDFVRWRLLVNENDVSEMKEGKDICVHGICVHGIPVHVSPKKESRNTKGLYYVDAKLSDGKKCARLVSFEIAHRDAIKKAEEDQSVVALSRSIVKKSVVSARSSY